MTEREQLKAEILEEVMKELEMKSNKRVPALEEVRKKWFFGADPIHKYDNSKMHLAVGSREQHVVWDAVKTITRVIFQQGVVVRLRNLDQAKVERVASAICETVYNLAVEERKLAESAGATEAAGEEAGR